MTWICRALPALVVLALAGPVAAQDNGWSPTEPAVPRDTGRGGDKKTNAVPAAKPGSAKATAPVQDKKDSAAAAKRAPATTAGAAASDSSKATAQAAPPAAAPAMAAAPAQVTVPPPEVLLMLVRTTLIALNQANFTGNYAVLHGLGTPGLRSKTTPDKFGEAFKALRDSRVDLSPVLVLTPQLSEPPVMAPEGVMTLKGFFPTRPLQVNFAMAFQPVEGRWLIDGLSVATVPVDQVATVPAAPAPVAPAPKP